MSSSYGDDISQLPLNQNVSYNTRYSTSPLITIGITNSNILNNLPDQYTQYDNMPQNPLDFYTGSGEFDVSLFNQVFLEEQKKRQAYYQYLEEKKLAELNKEPPAPKIHELSIGKHLLKMKDTLFNIIQDLYTTNLDKYDSTILTKNNRMFYIGLFIVIFFILYTGITYLVNNTT
jgi:hypothetical protein